jgi:hypothetical protein
MKDMASVDPEVRVATWRSVAAIASLVRYMLTPVDATTAGLAESKPDAASRSHHASPSSKLTGAIRRNDGMSRPRSTRRWRFHAWGPG